MGLAIGSVIPKLDFGTGAFSREEAHTVRTVGQLAELFRDQAGARMMAPDRIVYEIHGCASEVEGPPKLLYATTVLHPGHVGNEYFMTRGHFHTDPTRGEFMLTLRGEGSLILMDRERNTWMEPMKTGSVHDVDGRFAHRAANTGPSSLVFLVTWMSDCGHDYESIAAEGFGKRLVAGPSGPTLI